MSVKSYGYYRVWQYEVSDEERALIDELEREGVDKIYSDRPHKTKPKKVEDWIKLIKLIKAGDYVVLPELHYLGAKATLEALTEAVREIMQIGAHVRVLRPMVDTGTPEGEVFVEHLEMINAADNELRTRKKTAGTDKAKKDGKMKGRRATIQRQCGRVIRYRYYRDRVAIKDIAKECKITEQSVRKVLDPLRDKVEEIQSSQPQLIADSHTDEALLRLGEQLGTHDRHLLRHIRDYVLMEPKKASRGTPSESRQSM